MLLLLSWTLDLELRCIASCSSLLSSSFPFFSVCVFRCPPHHSAASQDSKSAFADARARTNVEPSFFSLVPNDSGKKLNVSCCFLSCVGLGVDLPPINCGATPSLFLSCINSNTPFHRHLLTSNFGQNEKSKLNCAVQCSVAFLATRKEATIGQGEKRELLLLFGFRMQCAPNCILS